MTRDLFGTVPSRVLGRRAEGPTGPIALAELERMRRALAQIVLNYGDVYMPIFDRIDRECAARRTEDQVRDRLRSLANDRAA